MANETSVSSDATGGSNPMKYVYIGIGVLLMIAGIISAIISFSSKSTPPSVAAVDPAIQLKAEVEGAVKVRDEIVEPLVKEIQENAVGAVARALQTGQNFQLVDIGARAPKSTTRRGK